MKHSIRDLAAMLAAGAAVVLGCTACGGVAVEADYPVTEYDDYPPDGYIATTEPVYFEGHPTYYYRGRWFYRDGGHWHHYDHEPAHLQQWRSRARPERRYYEPRGFGPPRRSRGPSQDGRRRSR